MATDTRFNKYTNGEEMKESVRLESAVYQLLQIDKAYKRIASIAKNMNDKELQALTEIADKTFGIGMKFDKENK